jgi:hypothetical protein
MTKETSGVTPKRFLEILRAAAKKKDPVELELTKGEARAGVINTFVGDDAVHVGNAPPIPIAEIASVLVRQAPPTKRVVDPEKLERLVAKSKRRGLRGRSRGSAGRGGGGAGGG